MQEYLLLPFVEIEIRFGTLSKNFDSSVDKNYFNLIKENLDNFIFKNIETKNTIEHINKNLKLISNKETLKESLMMKENVLKNN